MTELNHYETLQVSASVESKVIDAAYRRLCKKYHPDVNANHDAKARMIQINAAFEVLGDPGLRAKYDHSLSRRPSGQKRWQRTRSRKKSPPPMLRVSSRIISLGLLPAGCWERFTFYIENIGGGRLSGAIQSSTPMIEVEQSRFCGNKVTVRGRSRSPDQPAAGMQGRVYITSNGGSLDIAIMVNLEKPAPSLQVSPPVLIASLPSGDDSVQTEILVSRSDGLLVNGTLSTNCKWIRLRQSTFVGSDTLLGLTITRPKGVKPGSLYRATIRIDSDCGEASVDLRLRVYPGVSSETASTVDFGEITRHSSPVRLFTVPWKAGIRPVVAGSDDWLDLQIVDSSADSTTYRIKAEPDRLTGFWNQTARTKFDLRCNLTVDYGTGGKHALPVLGRLVHDSWLRAVWNDISKAWNNVWNATEPPNSIAFH